MIIDSVAYLGHWPFRKLCSNTALSMLPLMDRTGIDKAVVSSLHSVFYLDVQDGNRELYEEIASYRDRFLPLAVLNPAYPGWEADFYECFEKFGMKGLEIFPAYHHYAPDDGNLKKLLQMAGEAHIPVRLPVRLIDIRGRHWMDTPENLSPGDLYKIVSLAPKTDFLICSGNSVAIANALAPLAQKRSGRIFYDFARLETGSFNPSFQKLVQNVETSRIVFGSCAPFQYGEVALYKLFSAGMEEEAAERICGGNIAALFQE